MTAPALRRASLHALISAGQRHRDDTAGGVILPASMDATADTHAARRASWDLLISGLQHLADGGRQGAAGSLTTAVTRASLRNAPLASALGIPAPVFTLTTDITPCHDAHAEAQFLARRMAEAVQADIPASIPLIERALAAHTDLPAQINGYFTQLAIMHDRQCETLMLLIDRLPRPAPPPPAPKP